MRWRGLVAIALFTLSGCFGYASKPGEQTGDQGASYGAAITTPPHGTRPGNSGRPAPLDATGKIQVTITTPGGTPIAGILVRYRGPSNGSFVSDARGIAAVSVRPGEYGLDVQPCGPLTKVRGEAGADLTVIAGETTRGVIGGVQWEPRYYPIEEATVSPQAPWAVGAPFRVKVRVEDGCTSEDADRPADLSSWKFVTSGQIELVERPTMRSTAQGWLEARFRCAHSGTGDIVLRDPDDGTRFVHVMAVIADTGFDDVCE